MTQIENKYSPNPNISKIVQILSRFLTPKKEGPKFPPLPPLGEDPHVIPMPALNDNHSQSHSHSHLFMHVFIYTCPSIPDMSFAFR